MTGREGRYMRANIISKIDEAVITKKVNLANMEIQDGEVNEIMDYVKRTIPELTTLSLDNNHLSDDGALILAESLSNCSFLIELSLQHNDIGPKGASSIFSLKNNNFKLDILFHGNKIHDVAEMAEIERLSKENLDSSPLVFGRR